MHIFLCVSSPSIVLIFVISPPHLFRLPQPSPLSVLSPLSLPRICFSYFLYLSLSIFFYCPSLLLSLHYLFHLPYLSPLSVYLLYISLGFVLFISSISLDLSSFISPISLTICFISLMSFPIIHFISLSLPIAWFISHISPHHLFYIPCLSPSLSLTYLSHLSPHHSFHLHLSLPMTCFPSPISPITYNISPLFVSPTLPITHLPLPPLQVPVGQLRLGAVHGSRRRDGYLWRGRARAGAHLCTRRRSRTCVG